MSSKQNTPRAGAPQFADRVNRIHAARGHLLALAGYLILAAIFFWPLLRNIHTHILSYDNTDMPDGCDSFEFVWRYWWLLAVVRYGLNPLQCDWIHPPFGDNLLFHSHPWVSELLTLPLGLLLGPATGYNLMILLMLVFAAWVYHAMLYRAFHIHGAVAWFIGAAFGFSGYLVLRAHWHANMLGPCFWGAALAILIASYHQDRLTLARGAAMALFFWATFWNSFVEVFMLAIVLGTTAAVCEAARIATGRFSLRSMLAFYLPLMIGALSLLVLRLGPPVESLNMPLVDTSGYADFFRFPRLSIFASLTSPERPPNWGIGFSFVLLMLAALGAIRGFRRHTATTFVVLLMVAATFVIAADPLHLVSDLVRRLPLGQGFRIFTRFTPFIVFFLGILAARGGDWLWKMWAHPTRRTALPQRDWGRSAAVAVIGLLLLVELFPVGSTLRPLRLPAVPKAIQQQLRSGGYCLVVPEGPVFIQPYDIYQVALDAPCAILSFWDKMDKGAKREREAQYPNVYPAANTYPLRPHVEDPNILPELAALDIRYVLFADKRQLPDSVIRGNVLLETDREILLRIAH